MRTELSFAVFMVIYFTFEGKEQNDYWEAVENGNDSDIQGLLGQHV